MQVRYNKRVIALNNQQFAQIVSWAIDLTPKTYLKHLKNVAFVVEDEPTEAQREQLALHLGMTLYGLYEGVPLTRRGGLTNYPPDKITIFRQPILVSSQSEAEVKEKVRHTVWHEVAHYFGLNHDEIRKREPQI